MNPGPNKTFTASREHDGPVFICHNETNAAQAIFLALILESYGYATWCYELDSGAGNRLEVETNWIADKSSAFVCLLSPRTIEHPHNIASEVSTALRRRADSGDAYPLLFYTIDIPYERLYERLSIKQKELHQKISPYPIHLFELDPHDYVKPGFDLNTLRTTNLFLGKLFKNDLTNIKPGAVDQERVRWFERKLRSLLVRKSRRAAYAMAALIVAAVGVLAWWTARPAAKSETSTAPEPIPPAVTTPAVSAPAITPPPAPVVSTPPKPLIVVAAQFAETGAPRQTRSRATGGITADLLAGASISAEVEFPASAHYEAVIVYSNDTEPDKVEVVVNGVARGSFFSLSTGSFGDGWNVFTNAVVDLGVIEAGRHPILLRLASATSDKIEIDTITIQPKESAP